MFSITYRQLIGKMKANLLFFSSKYAISKTIDYARTVARFLVNTYPEVALVSGDGFPYYIAYLKNPKLPVAEIKRFHNELIEFYSNKMVTREFYLRNKRKRFTINELRLAGFQSLGREDPYELEKYRIPEPEINIHIEKRLSTWYKENLFVLDSDKWSYLSCLNTPIHKQFGDECPACDKLLFKPRNILRLFHDLDIQIIVKCDINVAAKIREGLSTNGFYSSSSDIERTLNEVGSTFPLDTTIIPYNTFLNGLKNILQSEHPVLEKINVTKLWAKNISITWPIGINLAFSLEPLEIKDDELFEILEKTKNGFIKKYGLINIIHSLQKLPRAHGRILLDENALEGITLRLLTKNFLVKSDFLAPRERQT